MTPEGFIDVIRETLFVALELAAPFLILVLLVGVLIALLQSLTHLHEMTLSFVPKMLVLFVALAIFFPWMMKIVVKFTHHTWVDQWNQICDRL